MRFAFVVEGDRDANRGDVGTVTWGGYPVYATVPDDGNIILDGVQYHSE